MREPVESAVELPFTGFPSVDSFAHHGKPEASRAVPTDGLRLKQVSLWWGGNHLHRALKPCVDHSLPGSEPGRAVRIEVGGGKGWSILLTDHLTVLNLRDALSNGGIGARNPKSSTTSSSQPVAPI